MTPEQTAWLAGLLEGEGCFYLQQARGRWKRGYPSLKVQMTDRDVVETVAGLIGATLQQRAPRGATDKPTYLACLMGWPAVDVMQAVLPYMHGRRRQKIDDLIAGYSDAARRENLTHCGRGHQLTPENIYVTPSTGQRRCKKCHSVWRANRKKEASEHG